MHPHRFTRTKTARLLYALLVVGAVALAGCQRRDAEETPAPPAPPERTVWDAAPARPAAWLSVDLAAFRNDERFAPLLDAVGSEAPGATAVLGDADRWLIYATDAFFTDRVHVFTGAWSVAVLAEELGRENNELGGALTPEPLPNGATMFTRAEEAWAVATDGHRLLATGPRAALEPTFAALPAGREGAHDPTAAAHARWEPPSIVRGALADRVGRDELAAPLRSLESLDVRVSLGAGIDLALVATFTSAEAAEAGQVAFAALVAVLSAELPPEVLADVSDGLTLEQREHAVHAWWEFDRAAVGRAIAVLTPLFDPPAPTPAR